MIFSKINPYLLPTGAVSCKFFFSCSFPKKCRYVTVNLWVCTTRTKQDSKYKNCRYNRCEKSTLNTLSKLIKANFKGISLLVKCQVYVFHILSQNFFKRFEILLFKALLHFYNQIIGWRKSAILWELGRLIGNAYTYMCVSEEKGEGGEGGEVRNVCFSENLTCFIFMLPPFWDLPFCLITDDISYVR